MFEKYTPLYIHINWKIHPISHQQNNNYAEYHWKHQFNYDQIFKAVFLQTVFLQSFCSKCHISANTLNIAPCNISLFSSWCALFKNPIKSIIIYLEKGLILGLWVTYSVHKKVKFDRIRCVVFCTIFLMSNTNIQTTMSGAKWQRRNATE